MPPPVALLLCSAFVLFLLHMERTESRGVSALVWVPTLWYMSISTRSLGMWFGVTGESNEAGSPLDQWFLLGLTVVGIAIVAHRRYDWRGALWNNPWLLVLVGYMLISTLWSDITSIAFRRWVREPIAVVMALVIMSDPRPRQALESLLRRCAYVLVPFSLLLIKYYPTKGILYPHGVRMWTGVTSHKNSLGVLCMICGCTLLWGLYRRRQEGGSSGGRLARWADLSVLAIVFFLLRGEGGGYSATSLASAAVGVAGFTGLLWLRKRTPAVQLMALLVVFLGLIAIGASAPLTGGANVAVVSGTLGRADNLTGRTDVWAALLPAVMERPLLGYGFGSFWTTSRRVFYDISHGHNGYLDIVLDLGIVGLGFYVAWLLSCTRKLHATLAENHVWASFGICILLMAVVHNTAEPSLSSLSSALTAVVIFAGAVVPIRSASAPIGPREETRSRPSRRRLAVPTTAHLAPGMAKQRSVLGRSPMKR